VEADVSQMLLLEKVSIEIVLLGVVVVPVTQTKAAEAMLLPVVKERQSPTFPLEMPVEREGVPQFTTSEMTKMGSPPTQDGRETMEIAAVWFASRHFPGYNGIAVP
jgi:hypothetical protein